MFEAAGFATHPDNHHADHTATYKHEGELTILFLFSTLFIQGHNVGHFFYSGGPVCNTLVLRDTVCGAKEGSQRHRCGHSAEYSHG